MIIIDLLDSIFLRIVKTFRQKRGVREIMGQEKILHVENISKTFPGVKALNGINLDLYKGEVLILVGENGAGKSTLVKILSGIYTADEGSKMILDGQEYLPKGIRDANAKGVYIIHQELNMIPDMTVTENLLLSQGFPKYQGMKCFVNWKKADRQAQEILDQMDLKYNLHEKVESLSVANQQMLEISKAISQENAKVIIMDEPTASITASETDKLFEYIHRLKEKGIGIIYISHRLEEIKRIGDRIVVMRDGTYVGEKDVATVDVDEVIRMMVGREVTQYYPKSEHHAGDVALEVQNLSLSKLVKNINLKARKGEVLGIGGLVGSGRTELMSAIFGAERVTEGKILINGKPVKITSPKAAVANKIAFLTEDRKRLGLLMGQSIWLNTVISKLGKLGRYGFMTERRATKVTEDYKKTLKIRMPSSRTPVENLSGGNQQKVIFSRWLYSDSDIIMFDEPTRGIDVGAKTEMYELIDKLVLDGKTVILISSDMMELMGISDRIAVLSNGVLSGVLEREEFNQEKIMELALQGYMENRGESI